MSRKRKRPGRVTKKITPLTFQPNLMWGLSPVDVRNSAAGPTVMALHRAGVCLAMDVPIVLHLMMRAFTMPNFDAEKEYREYIAEKMIEHNEATRP